MSDLKLHDIMIASERLEGTYIIRLFAECETGLCLFWKTMRDTDPDRQDPGILVPILRLSATDMVNQG